LSKKIIVQHKPIFDKKDAKSVYDVIKSGWISEGKETKKIEDNFKKFIGTKYAVATTSGTSAISLALMACGIKRNDEVIIPNLTFAATANAVKLVGAKPILTEIDDNNFSVSLMELKKNISPKTKAIIPVHFNGRSTNLDELAEICERHDLMMIEDAAQALGSKYKKKFLGSFGDAGAFSLSPPKIITSGQGGIVTSNNFDIFDRLRDLKDQGRHDKSDNHPIVGFNFKFTDFQAALGNSQFAKLKSRLKKTKQIHEWYKKILKNKNFVKIPQTQPEAQLWHFDILVNSRQKLIQFLFKNKIQTRAFYKPLSEQLPFKTRKKYPITKKISYSGLFLPSASDLTFTKVKYICEKIELFYKKSTKVS